MIKTNFNQIKEDLKKAAAKKQAQENGFSQKKYEKVEWMKIPFGDTTFMVLPPKAEGDHIYHETFIHHNFVDPTNPDKKRSYKCSKQEHGSCPLCDKVEEMKKQGLIKEAAQLQAQKVVLYNVMDQEGNVKVAPLKPSQHAEVIQEINTNFMDEDVDVTDPHNGKMIKLSRFKAAPWARARVLSKKVDLAENRIAEILEKTRDLKTIYFDLTPEDLRKALDGEDVYPKKKSEMKTSEEVEEEVETPAPVAKAQPTKPAKVEAAKVEVPKKVEKKVEPKKKEEVAAESTGDDELDAMLNDLGLE